ncbi:unnamed protein product [Anisakis simplex]|uniref:G_PROTEIN_RECEP_F1_2 domain-containing protein n=1 Tax=Anisakis simplex TaxID=6269 RepID=A0A0M3JTF6_ANISI|nr:unnamed protein product [Anisakis simplex]
MGLLDNISDEYRERVMQFYNETKRFEAHIGIIIPAIFACVIAIGLVGNLLVVIVALHRQMRNSTNTLILDSIEPTENSKEKLQKRARQRRKEAINKCVSGLACSDLMFLTLCVPFTAIDYALPVWIFPRWMCSMINYLQHSAAYFSVWTLTLMAADRFLAVCYPVESMTLRNTSNTTVTLAIVYTAIVLSQIPVASIHDIYVYDFIIETRSTCAIVRIATGEASITEARRCHIHFSIQLSMNTFLKARLYFFSFNVFGYLLPLGITCVFYYFMLRRLWYTPRPGRGAEGMRASIRSRPETVRAKKKITRLVLCVVVIWAFCWLPLNICFMFSGVVYPETLVMKGGKLMVIIQILSQVLAYTNSCLNPILYAFLSDNFRKGFTRIFTVAINICTMGRCCKENRECGRVELIHCKNGLHSLTRMMPSTNACASSSSHALHFRITNQVLVFLYTLLQQL